MKLRRRWVRSWPLEIPEHRSYVVDQLPRLRVSSFDLAENGDSWSVLRDCTLLEWDIIVSPEQMIAWERYIDQSPGYVHVAPYRVYAGSGYPEDTWMPPWGKPAEHFGFGMIWFPALVLDRFREVPHHPHAMWFTDGTFSDWYVSESGPAVAHWDIEPVHLNYQLELP